jgi:hypothetical protein
MYTLTNLLNDIPVAGVLLAIIFIYAVAVVYILIDAVFISNGLIDEFEDIEPEPKSTVPESSNNEN